MSNLDDTVPTENRLETPSSPAIERVIDPAEKDLGGFSVRRLLPAADRRMVGPWIFFDHFGPAHFPAGQGIDVRPHPHINLATVTYLFDGEILHRDSLANLQAIRPGDINLMVAGSGIVHSEREREAVRLIPHDLHGLQLWLALPAGQEEIDPAFYHHPAAEIPATEIGQARVRVLMGRAYGLHSPVKTFAPTLYVEAFLPAGQKLELPMEPERAIYVAEGEIVVEGATIVQHRMAVLAPGRQIEVQARHDSRIALIGGASPGERFINWNFVSSRRERIAQARDDWRSGRFPPVPGDELEFIPLPD